MKSTSEASPRTVGPSGPSPSGHDTQLRAENSIPAHRIPHLERASHTTPRRRRCRDQRGVSLVETMVALSILAISSATVGEFIVRQTRMANTNNLTSIGQALAEQQFEDLRAIDYDDIAATSSTTTVGGIVYTLRTDVQTNMPAPNMKQISVDVSWKDPLGTQHVTAYTIYTAIKR
jgi:prepilin-type N-terminal cleavage/methylation domain-containing protein